MDGNRIIDGEFWIAGRYEDRCPGYLKVAPRAAPTVEVLGQLTPWLRETRRETGSNGNPVVTYEPFDDESTNGPFVIHGIDGSGTKLTLIDGVTSDRDLLPLERHGLRGAQAVVGAHLESREQSFEYFRLRFEHLDAWRTAALDPARVKTASLEGGGTITLHTLASPRVWLSGQSPDRFTLRGLDRLFERPLISLFTLAIGAPCEMLDIQVKASQSDDTWLDVFTSSLHVDDGSKGMGDPRWLLRPADVGLDHISAWLNRVDQLGPLPPGVADTAQEGTISLETQVLQLTTIAEGLHRALFPNERKFEKDVSKRVRDAAVAAANAVFPDAAETVKSLLGFLHQPSYSMRLKRIAEVVGDAVPGVTGDTDRWKSAVTKARNAYAHRLTNEFLQDKDVDRYLMTALSLRWLLTGLLLLQADFAPEKLTERFTEYSEYQMFLSRVREWEPRIYGEDSRV